MGREPHLVCTYGVPGDHLWVRETWRAEHTAETRNLYYRADEDWHKGAGWSPSIHMPRWASRLTLEVTEVRVQRLQEIGPEDAWAEGVADCPFGMREPVAYALAFGDLWDSINGERASWESNPWVWAVSFKVIRGGPCDG